MAKLNIDKIYSELEKCETTDELWQTYNSIKDFVVKKLDAEKKDAENIVEDIDSKIQKINGN